VQRNTRGGRPAQGHMPSYHMIYVCDVLGLQHKGTIECSAAHQGGGLLGGAGQKRRNGSQLSRHRGGRQHDQRGRARQELGGALVGEALRTASFMEVVPHMAYVKHCSQRSCRT